MLSDLAKRCVELSYRNRLTHVSSVLNTVDLIAEIYTLMAPNDVFVLGAGHASLAHFVVLESLGKCDAQEMINDHGVHSKRDPERGIIVSNGSLGQSETVAVGLALADKNRTVWLVTSDGSCMEGSVYEAFRIANKFCPNLKIFLVFNGTGAYGKIRYDDLPVVNANVRLRCMGDQLPEWLRGIPGHYLTLDQSQFEELMS